MKLIPLLLFAAVDHLLEISDYGVQGEWSLVILFLFMAEGRDETFLRWDL